MMPTPNVHCHLLIMITVLHWLCTVSVLVLGTGIDTRQDPVIFYNN